MKYEQSKQKKKLNILTNRDVTGKTGSSNILRRVSDMHQEDQEVHIMIEEWKVRIEGVQLDLS